MADGGVANSLTYWERVAQNRWGQYVTGRELAALRSVLGRTSPGTALEVGCEGGRWSVLMHDRGWRVVCTDVDAISLARCQARIPDARCIHVSPEDETLPVGTGEAQLVLVYEVHQVIESAWFIPEAARVLSPGGALVCSYWNPFSLRGAVYRLLARVRASQVRDGVKRFQDYYRGPAYRTFRSALRTHGFRVVLEEGICWFPFRRASNSALVPVAVGAEKALGLRRLPTVSPWVLCVALRDGDSSTGRPVSAAR